MEFFQQNCWLQSRSSSSMLLAPLPRLSERKVLSATFDFISLIFTFGEPLLLTPDVPRGGAQGQRQKLSWSPQCSQGAQHHQILTPLDMCLEWLTTSYSSRYASRHSKGPTSALFSMHLGLAFPTIFLGQLFYLSSSQSTRHSWLTLSYVSLFALIQVLYSRLFLHPRQGTGEGPKNFPDSLPLQLALDIESSSASLPAGE